MAEIKRLDAKSIAALCVAEAEERKAENVTALKVTELTTIADYFVLCTANSEPHLKAIGDRIEKAAREKMKLKPITVDGTPSSEWIVIDFGPVLVHIMTPEMRDHYQLESLWGDAPRLDAVRKLEELSSS